MAATVDLNSLTDMVPGETFIPEPIVGKTKRGVNLGCGTLVLPCEQPHHHKALPETLYGDDAGIKWDNVDRNQQPGVSHKLDLFTYPWALESNTYDVAICAHIVEHIPHHIIWNGAEWGDYKLDRFAPYAQDLVKAFGQVIPAHPKYQDGWFAWFSELWRILKPGGKAYILVPYAWSNSGISDPTHTRYITWATMNYFNNATDENPTFRYAMEQRWKLDLEATIILPHEAMMNRIETHKRYIEAMAETMTFGYGLIVPDDITRQMVQGGAQLQINAITDLMFEIEAVK